MQEWRCNVCGNVETVHVNFARLDPPLPSDLEPVFNVVGRWVVKPTAQQVTEVQGMFPKLRNVSGTSLLRKAFDHTSFELGRLTESEMRSRGPRLQELGIEVEMVPVASE